MMKEFISKGNTFQEALDHGLKKLNSTEDEVDYKILEKGKTVLGVVLKPFIIKLIVKNDALFKEDINDNIVVEENISDSVDSEIHIEISQDKMKAYLTVISPVGGKLITKDEVIDSLNSYNIIHGVKYERIDEIIASGFNTQELIAEGSEPANGEDGKIVFNYDTSLKAKPKILENGYVDFKELDIIANVRKGDILATKILPTDGKDGKTVTGVVIKSKAGKPAHFKKGKNVFESEDGLNLIASEDGFPKILDDKLTVHKVYEIKGNVDNATGNIFFNGKVLIKGNVCTGFEVECEGDIEVFGVVEGAILIANGDIILHKGMQGQNVGKISSKGNIKARYMESCYAKADGCIYADVVMHSVLESKESIFVSGKKGMIMGGETRARNEISALTIGSPMSTDTKLEVGSDPELKQKFERLKQEQEILFKSREGALKAIELLTKLSKSGNLPIDKQEMLVKSTKTKEYLSEKINDLKSTISSINDSLMALSSGRIHVYNTIYPGVKITIGNSVYYTRESIKCSTILREDGEIKTTVFLGK